jgi:guanylate cyclase
MTIGIKSPLRFLSRLGGKPDDSSDVRLQKSLLVIGCLMFSLAGAAWGAVYIVLGEQRSGLIPLSYAVISFLSFLHFSLKGSYRFFRASQLILILLLPFFLMVSLGGYVNSSAVILWSLLCPLGALLFAEQRTSPRWFVAYLALVILSGFLQPYVRLTNLIPSGMLIAFFVLNIGAVSLIVFLLLYYFIGQKNLAYTLLHQEQERSESLLLNVLPAEIADRLKAGERTIADHYDSASVLFADLVGFTPLAVEMPPVRMVELLNEIYSHFDSLVEKYQVEKIRTIGDSYMIASGVPHRRPDHAHVLARLALELNAYLDSFPPVRDRRMSFRIGVNSGPLIAGIIGRKKFSYDVWGDTVNTASRMESHGEPGKIQITAGTYELIKNEFICEPRGQIEVKGKGLMDTWYLVGEK